MNKFLKVLKNYYVVFSVCILCIIVTMIMFGLKNYREFMVKKAALEEPFEVVDFIPEIKDESENTEPYEVKIIEEDIEEDFLKEPETDTASVEPEIKEFKIILPVNGDVSKEFSGNNLMYSNTFKDYRTHNGIDISANKLQEVANAFDGVVEGVFNDSIEGAIVIVNHNNGFKSIYKNLSEKLYVTPGDYIMQGMIIGALAENCAMYEGDEAHLHFEVKKDEKNVNPLEYLY